MSRFAECDRAKVAEAYELAGKLAGGYIRAGIKVQAAAIDHGISGSLACQSWGPFISALACKMVEDGAAEEMARGRRR